VATVLHDILENVAHLVRGEMRLAKAEVLEEIGVAGASAKLLVAGIALAYLAAAFLLLCAFLSLELAVAPWMAALLVGVGTAAIATLVISGGLKRIERAPVPSPVVLISRTGSIT